MPQPTFSPGRRALLPAEVRVWQEEEDPLKVVAGFLRDRKLATRPVGIEETVRFFIPDMLAKALPSARIVTANPVVRGCRMIKAPAELALMQLATDGTIAAYRWVYPRVAKGMTGRDVAALMDSATEKLGGSPEFSLALIGEAAAYPLGTKTVHRVGDGEIVLMDCGCTVQGYQSDVSRTFVFGTASKEQRMVWDQVHQGQQVALAAARIGAPAGSVDVAIRKLYESFGYGPGYKLPGCSHRTGHGIGLDGHEPVYLVRGETTRLAPGMCFSNEPGIYIPGKFGVWYEQVPAVDRSRRGDPARVCLAEIPTGCPKGDDRGREYKVTNLRTKKSWRLPDAEHGCGGA